MWTKWLDLTVPLGGPRGGVATKTLPLSGTPKHGRIHSSYKDPGNRPFCETKCGQTSSITLALLGAQMEAKLLHDPYPLGSLKEEQINRRT